jgi:hypothetical protein
MKKRLPLLRERITSNGIYKTVALIVAIVIWTSTLWTRKDAILIRDMDLEFLLRANHQISNVVDRTVKVKVAGPRTSLKRFVQVSSVVSINLSDETIGLKEVEISSRTLDLPAGVKLLSVTPNRLKVDIKEVTTDGN